MKTIFYLTGAAVFVGVLGALGWRVVQKKKKPPLEPEKEEEGEKKKTTPKKSGGNNPPSMPGMSDFPTNESKHGVFYALQYPGIDIGNSNFIAKPVPKSIVKMHQNNWNKVIKAIDAGEFDKPNGNFRGYLLVDGDPGKNTMNTFNIIMHAMKNGDMKGSWIDLMEAV